MSPLARFVLNVALWLPLCFGAWYFFAILWIHPVAMATDWIMGLLVPEIVESVADRDRTPVLGGDLRGHYRAAEDPRAGSRRIHRGTDAGSVWGRELIAIGYQLGYLIVPSVIPAVVWLVQFRGYVHRLTQAQG